jgi:hypothetical protein
VRRFHPPLAASEFLNTLAMPIVGDLVESMQDEETRLLYARLMARAVAVRDGDAAYLAVKR